MAIKEGRCTNCGSILFLDSEMPKGHCFFCDAVFENEEAFRAHQHPEDYSFPNEKQPKYEGPSLTPAAMQRVVAPAPRPVPKVKEEAPAYTPPAAKVPSLKIPLRSVAIFTLVALLLVGVFAAVAFPLVNKRNKHQTAIIDRFSSEISYSMDKTKDIAVHEMDSSVALIVLSESLTAAEAVDLFETFCGIRADVLELKDRSFASAKSPVSFQVATPQGGYLIKNPADEGALVSDIVVLD